MNQEKPQEKSEEKQKENTATSSNGAQTEAQAAPTSPTAEQLQTQLKEQEAKYLYLYAEFENFKKRMQKERIDLMKYGWEQVARDLLQVLDNLERANTHLPPNTDKTLVEGLKMVVDQFKSTLQKQGLQAVESLAQPFDPNLHEAIAHENSDQPEGVIISELSRGYTLHGRLLRPARVTVSNGQKT